MGTVFTCGHGTRTLEELVALLRSASVTRLVDVRRYPGSRRHPQFGKDSLAAALPGSGIIYDWRGEVLGGRRSAPKGTRSRHPAWRVDAFRAYADYMDTPAFREALTRLEQDAAREPLAVMCAETLWWRCHRRLIADALAVDGHEVIHLLSPTDRQPHPLHPQLRVDEDGRPVYDKGVDATLFG
jgi:uncharacterized protein (DUF488 family)